MTYLFVKNVLRIIVVVIIIINSNFFCGCTQSITTTKIYIDTLALETKLELGPLHGKCPSTFIYQDTTFIVLQDCQNNCLNIINTISPLASYRLYATENICTGYSSYYFKDKMTLWELNGEGLLRYKDTKSPELSYDVMLDTIKPFHKSGLTSSYTLQFNNRINVFDDSLIYFPVEQNVFFNKGTYSNKNFGFPVTGIYNIQKRSIITTGMSYPEFMYVNDYGLLHYIQQLYKDKDVIYYTFPFSAEIVQYNVTTNTSTIVECKSRYDTEPINPVRIEKHQDRKSIIWNHHKYSAHYGDIIYDPFSQLFYRFYEHKLEKTINCILTSTDEKRMSLMILDESLNFVDEILLPTGSWYYFAAPSTQGLLLNSREVIYDNNTKKIGIKVIRVRHSS